MFLVPFVPVQPHSPTLAHTPPSGVSVAHTNNPTRPLSRATLAALLTLSIFLSCTPSSASRLPLPQKRKNKDQNSLTRDPASLLSSTSAQPSACSTFRPPPRRAPTPSLPLFVTLTHFCRSPTRSFSPLFAPSHTFYRSRDPDPGSASPAGNKPYPIT